MTSNRNDPLRPALVVSVVVLAIWFAASHATTSEETRATVLATVNDEPITLAELEFAVAGIHERADEQTGMRSQQQLDAVLDRLITVRLIAQESRNIGLDQAEDVREELDAFRRQKLRETLYARQVAGITEAEPSDVLRRYRKRVAEVRLRATRFSDQPMADAFRQRLETEETSFEDTATAAVRASEAVSSGQTDWIPIRELAGDLADALAGSKPGDVVGPVVMEDDVVVAEVLEFRDPDDADARREAEQEAIEARRMLEIARYAQKLEQRYAVIDRELLEDLDFDENPDRFEAALDDDTAVATIDGGAPVTLADLAGGIRERFFHGADRAAEKGRLNRKIKPVLDDLIVKRVTILEAEKLGLDESPEFLVQIREHEHGVLFGRFVAKVIDPSIRIDEDEIRAYYTGHPEAFRAPELVRLESIPFRTREDAERARERLRSGADFAWTRLNSGGQIRPEEEPGLIVFRGSLYMVEQLPDAVRDAIGGVESGSYVLTETGIDSAVHLIRVAERFEAKTRPYDEVRLDAAQMLVDERRKAALEDWSRQLRDASAIEVRVTPEKMRELLMDSIRG